MSKGRGSCTARMERYEAERANTPSNYVYYPETETEKKR